MDTNQAVTLPSPHPGLTPAPSAPSVVSVGSSPFHGAPVSATQLCEVPDGEPAPVTPEWMLHAPLQPAEAGPADDACPVCLCVVLPCSVGPEARYEWPSCGHSLHLGCVAHLSVNSRAMSCPVCRSGWSVSAQDTFMRQCREQRVSLPQVAPSYSTRSVPSPGSLPPVPPDSVVALCCQHLALVDGSRPESAHAWVELPSRHMAWAPVHRPTEGRWDPEWNCIRCGFCLTMQDPFLQGVPSPPFCAEHGPRVFAVDVPSRQRGWICSRGHPPFLLPCPREMLPTSMASTPRPEPEAQLLIPDPSPAPPAPRAAGAAAATAWISRGPPRDSAPPGGNSWFFVPLLHAGACALRSDAAAQWEAHPFFGHPWRGALLDFFCAPPIACEALLHVLQSQQDLARQDGRQLSLSEASLPRTIAAARSALPQGSAVFLAWAVEQCSFPNGYIPATAQETLLLLFLGERRSAEIAAAADRFRSARPPPGHGAPAAPSAPPARLLPTGHAGQPEQPEQPAGPRHPGTPAAQEPPREPQVRPAPPSPDGPNGGGDGRSRSSHSRSSSSSSSSNSSSSSRGHSRSGSGDHRDRGAHPADPSDNRHSPHCDNSRSNDLAGQTHQPDPGPAPVAAPDARRLRRSLSSLDSVDLLQVLQERAFTFQFVPSFARGPVRQALTFALSAILDAGVNEDASMRAWKLWFLLPRLLLHRSPGVKKLPKQVQ